MSTGSKEKEKVNKTCKGEVTDIRISLTEFELGGLGHGLPPGPLHIRSDVCCSVNTDVFINMRNTVSHNTIIHVHSRHSRTSQSIEWRSHSSSISLQKHKQIIDSSLLHLLTFTSLFHHERDLQYLWT